MPNATTTMWLVHALLPFLVGLAIKILSDLSALKTDVENIKVNHLNHIYSSLEIIMSNQMKFRETQQQFHQENQALMRPLVKQQKGWFSWSGQHKKEKK